jgi:hypothetical protein
MLSHILLCFVLFGQLTGKSGFVLAAIFVV